MRWIVKVIAPIGYGVTKIVVGFICALSKIGLCCNLCTEFRAAMDLGAGGGAYLRQEYQKCHELLARYINEEDDHCHGGIKYQLALLYYYGRGVQRNMDFAYKLFNQSAALGWDDAADFLAAQNKSNAKRT